MQTTFSNMSKLQFSQNQDNYVAQRKAAVLFRECLLQPEHCLYALNKGKTAACLLKITGVENPRKVVMTR